MTTEKLAESQTEVESIGASGIEESQTPNEFDAFMSGTETGTPVAEPEVQPAPKVEPIPSVEQLMGRVKQLESGMSAQDQHLNQARQLLARQALDREIADAEAIEEQFQSQDRIAVDNGEMTATDATQRSRQRQEATRADFERRQRQNQETASARQLMQQAEDYGKVIAAEDFAKEFGVERDVLINDRSLTTPALMRVKARELALEKREAKLKGRDTFDSSQTSVSRPSVDNMSPGEKIAYGLAHPPRKR